MSTPDHIAASAWAAKETAGRKPPLGIACPECGTRKTSVMDSRCVEHGVRPMNGERVRRRRICEHGHRFTTHEYIYKYVRPRASSATDHRAGKWMFV